MKKILLLLLLSYSFSFATTCYEKKRNTYDYESQCKNQSQWYTSATCVQNSAGSYYMYFLTSYQTEALCSNTGTTNEVLDNGILTTNFDNGTTSFTPNPDPLGGGQCRDLFQKDGVAYTCNPNTNEATPIPNSDGVILGEDGTDEPNCNEGYSSVATQNMPNTGTTQGMYNSWSCEKNSGTGNENNETENPTFETPTTSTSQDGSTTWTWSDGTKQTLSSNGTLTTYYPDGSSSVKQVGNDYTPSSSSGGSGTSTGGGGNGTNGNTANENTDNTNTDTPTDNTPVSNSCNDSSLTLQEKMLCEMNAGVKKLNSESSPENSLNNLLKELNKDNNTNATAINTNLKDSKALQENQLNETKKVTEYLHSLENAQDGSNLLLEAANTKLEQIRDNIKELPEGSESFVDSINNNTNAMNESYNGFNTFLNDMKSSYNNLLNQFNDAKSTFQLGFTFNPIQKIVNSSNLEQCLTVSVFGGNEVFLDFITPLLYIKPITTLIIQIFMLVEVLRMCFRIFDYAKGLL